MNDDDPLPQELHRLAPRGAGPELRGRVLAAVGRELAAGRASRRPSRLALAVAASLLLGVAVNAWANKTVDRRLARLYGPRPVPRQIAEVAEAVASVTDAETGRLVRQQLTAAWRSRSTASPPGAFGSRPVVGDTKTNRKEQRHEDPQNRGDHSGGGDRGASGCQRDLGSDHRRTA